MNKLAIKQILLEQRQEIKKIFEEKIIEREIEKKIKKSLKDNLIKVIIGVRRSGKSVLCHRVLKDKNYGYINFDDERLIGVKAENLNDFLEVLKEINPDFQYLLLDEIQNVAGWELFVNRLRRAGYNIVITGSNSKLLSKELSTHLTGRHFTAELYPFSFAEFLNYNNFIYSADDFYLAEKRAVIKRYLNAYSKMGGFPELGRIELKNQYLRDLFDKIITRDVISRYKVKYVRDLKEIALYVSSNFSSRMSYHQLRKLFGLKSVHTIKNYLSFLEEAYLIFQLYPFSYKAKNRVGYSKKIYGIDPGMINAVTSQFSPNWGKIMENLVLLELKRRNREVYFYTDLNIEVDFVVKDGLKISQLIQVCFNIESPKTKKRETVSLLKAANKLKTDNLIVITWDHEAEEQFRKKKIKFIPLWKWLLLATKP
jgi:predicted AAA+ superfamily ATPase